MPDCITWADHLDDIYTSRSGYSCLLSSHSEDLHNADISWNLIWKMKAPKKVKLFFWTASHESLPTKALLHRRGMALSPSCHRCDDHVEDVLHYLMDCPLAACIWRSLGYNVQLSFKNYTLTRGSKKVSVSRALSFLWQVSGVFGKHVMWCVLVMSRLAVIIYDIMLGATLVLSRRPWVAMFSLVGNNAEPLGTIFVWKLRFSMLMGLVLGVPTAQNLEVCSVIRMVLGFVVSHDLLAFRTTCMRNYLRSCMV
jgi:hypothetical protein